MKITHLVPLLVLVGCVSQPPTFSPVPSPPKVSTKMPPPLPPRPNAVAAPLVLRSGPPPTNSVPAKAQVLATATLGTNYFQIQWLARPVSYSLDVSTNLTIWRSLGVSVTTNFTPELGQALIQTNLWPSGQAVVFTNGTPVIVFIDYDIDCPMKFYRLREIQP